MTSLIGFINVLNAIVCCCKCQGQSYFYMTVVHFFFKNWEVGAGGGHPTFFLSLDSLCKVRVQALLRAVPPLFDSRRFIILTFEAQQT